MSWPVEELDDCFVVIDSAEQKLAYVYFEEESGRRSAGKLLTRSATAQLLHASEAAFWSDLPLQMASLKQTVPDLDGTEIIIESTANVEALYNLKEVREWYTLQDGVVMLTDREGNPAGEETGRKFTHKLLPGEDARAVACKLTKELRLALRGNSAPVAGFEGKINYPKVKY